MSQLVDRAIAIRDETVTGANTATRVGQWMLDALTAIAGSGSVPASLTQQATAVRDEVALDANTAARVGGWCVEALLYVGEKGGLVASYATLLAQALQIRGETAPAGNERRLGSWLVAFATYIESDALYLNASPTSVTLQAPGTPAATVNVSSNATWYVHGSSEWITTRKVTDSHLSISALPNTGTSPRSGIVILANADMSVSKTIAVTQVAELYISFDETDIYFPYTGSPDTQNWIGVHVTTNMPGAFIHQYPPDWVNMSSQPAEQKYWFEVTRNDTNAERVGTIVIGAAQGAPPTTSLAIHQAANPGQDFLQFSPGEISAASSGGAYTLGINCSEGWTLAIVDNSDPGNAWITPGVTSGSAGQTNATVTVSANAGGSRAATIKGTSASGIVATTRVIQASGEPSYLDVVPATLNVGAGAGSVNFNIISNLNWEGENMSSWLEIKEMAGTGNVTNEITYEANEGLPRDTVATFQSNEDSSVTDTLTVHQAGAPVDVVILADPAAGGTTGATSNTYEAGTVLNLVATPNEHYTFVKWQAKYGSNPWTDLSLQPSVTLPATPGVGTNQYKAIFERSHYAVALSSNDASKGKVSIGAGAAAATASAWVAKAGSAVIHAAAVQGYRFIQWSDGNTSADRTLTNISADTQLTAVFGDVAYISVSPNVINATAAAGSQSFAVTASGGWTVRDVEDVEND
jgi:hypothetical protein